MKLVADIETNGLLNELTKVHSLVLRERGGDILLSCTDDPRGKALGYRPIAEGLAMLADAETIYAHNGISFDIPALKKVYPDWTYRGTLFDTLVIVAFRWAHIKEIDFNRVRKGKFPGKLAGSHSLEAWGVRLGCHKGEYKDWCAQNGIDEPFAEWRPEMQIYCEQDTQVTDRLADRIGQSGVMQESPMAVEIEHKLAWYLSQQERNGWPFDVDKAVSLQARLSARREELAEGLREHFGWWYAANGVTDPKRDNQKKGVYAGAPYTKLKVVEFNPGSRDHIARCLQVRYGWKPEVFTDSGKPQVDEKCLKGLRGLAITDTLMEFLAVEKTLGQVSEGQKAWMRFMTDKGPEGGKLTGKVHIHGRCIQNKAATHRAAHANPNIAQVPKVSVDKESHEPEYGYDGGWGADCRELFHVPAGWVQVGADASGLQLRCLAHYMARYDGGAYGKVILEGRNEDATDIHSVNAKALGLEGKNGRDRAKTFIYAYLFGAGDEKLGSILEPGASKARKAALGKRLRKTFESNLPAMGYLVEAVTEKVGNPGYLSLPDNRRCYIRHKHAALNYLLQGAEAVICKLWIVTFAERLTAEFGDQGWSGKWAGLAWVHDEVQIAVRPEIAPRVSEILVDSIRYVSQVFAWRCALDGEAKTGRNWMQTH